MRSPGTFVVLLTASLLGLSTRPSGQLHWPDPPKKVPMRIRVVAVAISDPRSSYFVSHEVLIAEREIAHDEWSLIKLVYDFLPYQPKLSETGFDYNIVYDVTVARDLTCDETVAQLTTREWPDHSAIHLSYAHDAPISDLEGRHLPLPCYQTNADDFSRYDRQPTPADK